MMNNPDHPDPRSKAAPTPDAAVRKLSPAAQRALAEATARRAEIDRKVATQPAEVGRKKGSEPVRYGDWEVKGIASDF